MTRTRKLLPFGLGLWLGAALALTAAPTLAQPAAGPLAGKPFSVTIEANAAKVGTPSTATVTFKAAKGYHLNKDFPTSLKLNPATGITLPKANLHRADAKALTEQQGSFQVALTASSAGPTTINGTLRFAVCTETTCEPQSTPVTIPVDVKP